MSFFHWLTIAGAGLLGVLLITGPAARVWLRRTKASVGRRRDRLWETFYGLDWGETTTNNYGFAPTDGDGPERFQLQMYAEHLDALEASGRMKPHTDLLEISCGRGGGLAHLVRQWPRSVAAIGLDLSANAVRACEQRHADVGGLRFVRGSALALPFLDASFDVVVNVEASNDYGDFRAFFDEVHRVLRPGGVFLYCDTRRAEHLHTVPQVLRDAGLIGEFIDITDNVVLACQLDSPRRRQLLRRRAPWLFWLLFRNELLSYAGVEGSGKYQAFIDGRRRYVMTCAVKPGKPARSSRAAPARQRARSADLTAG
jgi:SAM-dependent methyltransferase